MFFPAPSSLSPLHSFPTRRSSDLAGLAYATSDSGPPDASDLWPGSSNGPTGLIADAVAVARRGDTTRLGHLLADRKSTRLNSSHQISSYAVLCLKIKKM